MPKIVDREAKRAGITQKVMAVISQQGMESASIRYRSRVELSQPLREKPLQAALCT